MGKYTDIFFVFSPGWSSGIWDFCNEGCVLFLTVFFCPLCIYGRAMELALGAFDGRFAFVNKLIVLIVLNDLQTKAVYCLFGGIFFCCNRSQIREKYTITEVCWNTYIYFCCLSMLYSAPCIYFCCSGMCHTNICIIVFLCHTQGSP